MVFRERVDFPGFGVSHSSEISGQVLSGFHGFLEHSLIEFVNFVAYAGSMPGLEFGTWGIARLLDRTIRGNEDGHLCFELIM